MNELFVLLLSRHGVVRFGGRHVLGRLAVALPVFTLSCPPVIANPLSNTTLPSRNVTAVPLPMHNPLGQSTHQLPDTATVPGGSQLCAVYHRWYEDGIG